jgi:hypothetical protein
MRPVSITLLPVLAGCLLAACGADGSAKDPPGSESNPLIALPNPSATRTPPVERPGGEGAPTAKTPSGGSKHRAPASSSTRTQRGSVARRLTASGETAGPKTAHKQKALPRSASQPCSLVTKTQASAIVGAPIVAPLQAPQGPTCIYQAKSGKPYVTLAVQTVDFTKLRKQIRATRTVSIANRTAYCGTYGKPMLFLPVAGGRVLTIAAPCTIAQRFAAKAAPHL